MFHTKQSPSFRVPGHYIQVACDFKRLLHRLKRAQARAISPVIMVHRPASAFLDWDKLFVGYQRNVDDLFHALSIRVLAKADHVELVDTVRYLVPLEQWLIKLLNLRAMVSRHQFSGEWRQGQELFLARINKILQDFQDILLFFITAVEQYQSSLPLSQDVVWSRPIECTRQTESFIHWLNFMGIEPGADYSFLCMGTFLSKLKSLLPRLITGAGLRGDPLCQPGIS